MVEISHVQDLLTDVDLRVEIGLVEDLPNDLGFIGIPCLASLEGPRLYDSGHERFLHGVFDAQWCTRQGFEAKAGQVLSILAKPGALNVILFGLGLMELDQDPSGDEIDAWRLGSSCVVRCGEKAGSGAILIPPAALNRLGTLLTQSVVEGASLCTHKFDAFRSAPRVDKIDRLIVAVETKETLQNPSLSNGVSRAILVARAVNFARDLINTPPSTLTPSRFAKLVLDDLSTKDGVRVEAWGKDRIESEKMGGLLGVSRGSHESPVYMYATYDPSDLKSDKLEKVSSDEAKRTAHIVLVGKGITFDSGGLSLKTPEGMTTMKTDMSGAAIVMATLGACADLRLGIRVSALAPITENMPGGGAIKPGDVLKIRNGLTIEVLNTDAEGRLVLADALSHASEMKPEAIVDIATLTGAVRVALGDSIAGLFMNDMGLEKSLMAASSRTSEKLWPLPLPKEYEKHIDSNIADMKNIGEPGQAGAISAALLLQRFVGDVPWAHIDIAGTGRSDKDAGYYSKGATAFGVRLLLEFLESYLQGVAL